MLEDVSYHRPTARLCPHGLHLQVAVWLADIEQGLDNVQLRYYAVPVEKMLVFLGREVDERAAVGPHAIDEHLGELVSPELAYRLAASSPKRDAVLHAVGDNAVQWAQQAVEEAGYPQVVLGKGKSIVAQRGCPEMLVSLAVVCHQCWHPVGAGEVVVACVVLGSQLPVASQQLGKRVHVHPRHFGGKGVGNRLEQWGGGRLV